MVDAKHPTVRFQQMKNHQIPLDPEWVLGCKTSMESQYGRRIDVLFGNRLSKSFRFGHFAISQFRGTRKYYRGPI